MRFAVGATVLAAALVRAEDASSSEAEASTATEVVAKSTFTVSTQFTIPSYHCALACIVAILLCQTCTQLCRLGCLASTSRLTIELY